MNTRTVAIKVFVGDKVVKIDMGQVVGYSLTPYPALAVRDPSTQRITRYAGFPMEIIDEETLVEAAGLKA